MLYSANINILRTKGAKYIILGENDTICVRGSRYMYIHYFLFEVGKMNFRVSYGSRAILNVLQYFALSIYGPRKVILRPKDKISFSLSL